MGDLKNWWELAQVGAGALFVLGPVAWLLWRRMESDTEYIRQSDRNQLEVLTGLTEVLKVLESDGKDGFRRLEDGLGTVKDAIDKNREAILKRHKDD